MTEPMSRAGRLGLLYGVSAVVFWSFGASFVYLGAREAGTWFFVAVGSACAALLQFGVRRAQHGELRTALFVPWRLWVGPVFCFVLYGLAWPLALASSTPERVFGVSLVNYLWPVLTVVCSVFLVPGVRLSFRTVAALALALGGLALANARDLAGLFSNVSDAQGSGFGAVVPYLLSLVAAITWAVYSALLARWRSWAQGYVTSPLGFLIIGLIGFGILAVEPVARGHIGGQGLMWTLLYGAGPLAAGYLLWELALARARVQTLSIIAAGTPVLSTALLCLFLRKMPGIELVLAAILVSAGVVLSRKG
ncbi:MAG TPA: EamA family transporter [Verrucomicrobiae bacterium]